MNWNRRALDRIEGLVAMYLFTGAWIVHCCNPAGWPWTYLLRVWLTWPLMIWEVSRGMS